MKRCENCGNEFSDGLINCPTCFPDTKDIQLSNQKDQKRTGFFKTKRFRCILFSLLIIIFISLTTYSASYIYNEHKTRFLTEAQTYLKIGDKKSAVPSLLKHLLANPNDFGVKLLYANTLNEIGETSKALEVYKAILENEKNELNPNKMLIKEDQDFVKWRICDVYRGLIEKSSKAAEIALSNKKCDEARDNYREISDYISNALEYYDTNEKDSISALDSENLIDKGEEISAKYAFSYWLEGNREKAYGIAEEWLIQDVPLVSSAKYQNLLFSFTKGKSGYNQKKNNDFADCLYHEGEKCFKEKKWDLASEAYRKAADYFKKVDPEDLLVAECLYNSATAYWNNGEYQTSKTLLNDVKSEFPDYQPVHVNNLIDDADIASLKKEAKEYFKQEDWASARAYYSKVISAWLKSGLPDSSDDVGVSRYNIFVTYWNEHKYVKAREELIEIQLKNPTYKPQIIKERLEQVERILKINGEN